MKISTDNPYRDIWTAIDSDNYDWSPDCGGAPMGQGNTEQAAINDLVERLVDAAYEQGLAEGKREGMKLDPRAAWPFPEHKA